MDVDNDAIDVQQMAENIVGRTTFDGYKLMILEISAWAWENQDEDGWFTEDYLANYEEVLLEVSYMRVWQRSRHLKEWIRQKLANAATDPIIVVDNATLERFMECISMVVPFMSFSSNGSFQVARPFNYGANGCLAILSTKSCL
jgi:hypothetical protein